MCDETAKNGRPTLRMSAYYYGFNPTGVELVDRILSAVAEAGKGVHNTEDWLDYPGRAWPPFRGENYIDFIQNAAIDAAHEHTALVEALDALLADFETMVSDPEMLEMALDMAKRGQPLITDEGPKTVVDARAVLLRAREG